MLAVDACAIPAVPSMLLPEKPIREDREGLLACAPVSLRTCAGPANGVAKLAVLVGVLGVGALPSVAVRDFLDEGEETPAEPSAGRLLLGAFVPAEKSGLMWNEYPRCGMSIQKK